MKKILPILVLVSLLALPAVGLAQEMEEAPEVEFMPALTTIMNWLFTILLVVAAICFIVAGFTFVTAGGDPEAVGRARRWILYAVVGVVVALLARGIVLFLQTTFAP